VKRIAFGLFLAILIFAVPAALADQTPVTITFMGVNGINDGTYYVSPYYGTMTNNGQNTAVTLFCVDFNNEVTWNQSWQANVTPLGSNDFSNTRFGNPADVALLSATDPYLSTFTPAQLYEQATWLTTQFDQFLFTDPSQVVALQYAIWDLFAPNGPTNAAAQGWIGQAQQNYNSINLNNFEIVTNVSPLYLTGQVQEFIVPTPEPGTITLLGAGLFVILWMGFRRAKSAGGSVSSV
jgi:hypothetical protein